MNPTNSCSAQEIQKLQSINHVVDVECETSEDVEKDPGLETRHKRFASLRYTVLNTYRRLFGLVFAGNVAAFIFVVVRRRFLLDCVNASAANLLACGLARQPLVVNLLFRLFCLIPRSTPLWLRHLACKIFHLGGVHSGCGIAACLWYLGFFSLFCFQFATSASSPATLVLSLAVTITFVAILSVAYPAFRRRFHDTFESVHRFGSWIIQGFFWALLLVVAFSSEAKPKTPGQFLVTLPAFWCLLLSTAATIQPWALLRRVQIVPEPLSTHAIRLHFSHTSIVFGQGISVSRHPLHDWHSFATITDRHDNDTTKFSCLVSKAGDWTAAAIAQPPTQLWVRGVPVFGFGYVMRVFSRIVVVTTGSGIGPCLSFVDDDERPAMRVVWQTRAPLKTYGQRTVDLVHRLDADPVVLDTSDGRGRVDMLPVVMGLWREFAAEAVCVISNPVVTKQLVFALESRGVRAYGPIFDS